MLSRRSEARAERALEGALGALEPGSRGIVMAIAGLAPAPARRRPPFAWLSSTTLVINPRPHRGLARAPGARGRGHRARRGDRASPRGAGARPRREASGRDRSPLPVDGTATARAGAGGPAARRRLASGCACPRAGRSLPGARRPARTSWQGVEPPSAYYATGDGR